MKCALALLLVTSSLVASDLPRGYWAEEKCAALLAKTEMIHLAPDLSHLTADERAGLEALLEAGAIFQTLYEQRHEEAISAYVRLIGLHKQLGKPEATGNLLQLYRLFQGPIATTLENKRETFLPVSPEVPGKNVYPWGVTKDEIESFLAANPADRDAILGERTAVRRAIPANLDRHLKTLQRYPVLDSLHPGLRAKLEAMAKKPDQKRLYAVPYAVAFGDDLMKAYRLLWKAAGKLEGSDPELARYLRNRARDLLSGDYESGDASWVTGHFKRLNAQIGAYETYDDALYGVKAFHSMSVLLLNEKATSELRKALGGIQEIEDALPYDHHKKVRENIPVGIYDVIADFGQARGTNTATILPNDPLFSRRYGRTILMRENIMTHPAIFAGSLRGWKAVVEERFADDLKAEGNFHRTLWHEIGHYLGVDADRRGRPLDVALQEWADALEEMKSDLVSLLASQRLREKGLMTEGGLRAIQASGIRRTLLNVRPRREQPYQTMQLAQFNYFLENGLLAFDPASKRLEIRYDRYASVVASLLREALALQYGGDKDAAGRLFDKYGAWTPELHEELAKRMRESEGARFRIVKYAALGE